MQPADAETLLFENALQESKDQIYRSPGKGREETVMCFFPRSKKLYRNNTTSATQMVYTFQSNEEDL